MSSPDREATRPVIPDHELVRCIGRGSYGEVWLARNIMGNYRAVKIVYRKTFENDRPFEREFKGIEKFEPISRSDNSQVNILHIGRNPDCFYYVMELADDQTRGQQIDPNSYAAKTLSSEMAQRGRLPFAECLEIGLALTAALDHLHKNGLVHRDVKPSNVIFVNGIPKLADIGLVTDSAATMSYVGTEGFLPPEGPGAPQADIYSLGKVLYEISTGKDRKAYPEPPTLLGEFSDREEFLELSAIVARACETDIHKRYATAEAMQADLLLLKTGKSVRRTQKLERRLKFVTRLGAALAAIIVLGALPYFMAIREAARATLAVKRETEQRLRAEETALRLKKEQQTALDELRDSYLAQAQAKRLSGRAGRRFESLELLKKAAEIRPSLELRNEAIACLALSDMRVAKLWNALQKPYSSFQFDGTYEHYAKGGDKGKITLHKMWTDEEILSLPGFGTPANTLFFSPSNRFMAANYEEAISPLIVWDLNKREILFKPNIKYYRTLDFSPDGRLLAIAHHTGDISDCSISIFDLDSCRETQCLRHQRLPYVMRFNPSGDKLAVSGYPSPIVEIWDVASGKISDSFTLPSGVRCINWHPHENLLAAAAADAHIYFWDVGNKKIRSVLTGHQAEALFVCFNHSGDLVSSISWDGNLLISDAVTARPLFSQRVVEYPFNFSQNDRWLGFAPDGQHVGVWEFAASMECRILRLGPDLERGTSGCVFSPDGQWLASTHRDGVRLWGAASAKELALVPEGNIYSAIFQTGGGSLLTSGGNGLKKWLIGTRQKGASGELTIGLPQKLGSWDKMGFACLDRNGEALMLVGQNNVHRFNLETSAEESPLKQSQGFDFGASSPDGRMVAASALRGSVVRIWEGQSGEKLKDLPATGVDRICFSPDNKWLVTTSSEDYRFWETGTWECRRTIHRERSGHVRCGISFTADGRMAAIASSVDRIRLFDPAAEHEFATLESPEPDALTSLCFSPDGTQLAAGTDAKTIQLWDLRLIRQRLAAMKLDWELPPYPPVSKE